MKFDMHCHTKEGSIDAKVELESYVKKLAGLGYDGMLVTDHNSYKGYDRWRTIRRYSKPFQNRLAKKLARRYHKPELGGSDGHRDEAIGTAFTEIDWDVRNNDDLIRAVKAGAPTVADGDWDDRARKKYTKFMEQFMIYGYWLLNKVLASGNLFRRRRAIQEIRRENKNEGTINKRKFT